MTAADAIHALIEDRLRYDEARSDGEWSVWEKKNLNIHRAVLRWHPGGAAGDYAAASAAVRDKVSRNFKRSWWRGFAFGVVLELPALPVDLPKCEADIDVRDNRKGTWQWTIVVCPAARVIAGVHTWTKGYLTPVYESVLDHYRAQEFEVGSFRKEKDKLMVFLTKMSGLALPEFEAEE